MPRRLKRREFAPWEVRYFLGDIGMYTPVEQIEAEGLNPFLVGFVDAMPSEYRAMWHRAREATLEVWTVRHPGTRPPAWWEFDAPEVRTDESEHEYLERLGLLVDGEQERLNSRAEEARGQSSEVDAANSHTNTEQRL